MTARLMDGKRVASMLGMQLKEEAAGLRKEGIRPCLAVMFNGDDVQSGKYAALKKKVGKEMGVDVFAYDVHEETQSEDVITLIGRLNNDFDINGLLLQFPLPSSLDAGELADRITPGKDIDCCGTEALGTFLRSGDGFAPCTALGVIHMLKAFDIDIAGKRAVVLGEGGIFDKAMALLFLKNKAEVSICSSKSSDVYNACSQADILCVSAGNIHMITADMVKDGAVAIDLGMNITNGGRTAGFFDFHSVSEKAAYITPVPGGLGPVTVALILQNTVLAAKIQNRIMAG